MKPSSSPLHTARKAKTIWICLGALSLVLFLPLFLTTIISLFFFYTPSPLIKANSINHLNHTIPITKPPQHDVLDGARNNCDVYKGHWILDRRGAAYTNATCAMIPDSNNCFKYGRKDRGFLKWRWKPDGCELQRFDGRTFLEMVKGKTMAFIGDSVARNHVESLLCLLSKDRTPIDVYKNTGDRSQTWRFSDHNFTLRILWSQYLVKADELIINGSASGNFQLNLDKVDEKWAAEISSIDYAIISSAHWFFRKIYVYDGSSLLGCVYCNEPNVTSLRPEHALRLAIRSTLNHINQCGGCGGMVTLLRTFSPPHFENGTWDSDGACPRTRPYRETEISMGSDEWLFRNAQVEEVERAGKDRGRRFGVLDVTRAMMMRPDGHPGEYWNNEWMKGYKDCVHWCMPGPIDVWSDFLMHELRRLGI